MPELAPKEVGRQSPPGSWCTIEHDNKVLQAKVVHIGRGKFKIMADNQNGMYIGRVVDASDIFGCDVEQSS